MSKSTNVPAQYMAGMRNTRPVGPTQVRTYDPKGPDKGRRTITRPGGSKRPGR